MVSGNGNFQQSPFNLATLGYRQPGSSFKIFTLAAALSSGDYSPYSEFDSHQLTIPFVKKGGNAFEAANGTGQFPVHNFGNEYAGTTSLSTATATSDNSVFAQLGLSDNVGTARVKHYAQLLGIRSPISVNPSMILGGLNTGVSALDMAHAYSTVANGGKKVYNNTLGDMDHGPVGIHSISGCNLCDDQSKILNNPRTRAGDQPRGGVDDRRTAPRPGRRQLRHRYRRCDSGGRHRRQDRNDLQLRGRLVRRLVPDADGGGMGRLPEQRQADDDQLRRQARRGRHLPGGHLPRLHDAGDRGHGCRGPAQDAHAHEHGYDSADADLHRAQHQHEHGSVDRHHDIDNAREPEHGRYPGSDDADASDRHSQQLRGHEHTHSERSLHRYVGAASSLVRADDRQQRRLRALDRVPHRHRQVPATRKTEAPGQIHCPRDPDPAVPLDLRIAERSGRPEITTGPVARSQALSREDDAERLRELSRSRAQGSRAARIHAAALGHQLEVPRSVPAPGSARRSQRQSGSQTALSIACTP